MVKVGVVGGTGYTGIELLRLLLSHPNVQVEAICSRAEAGKHLSEVYPTFSGLQVSGPTDLSSLRFQEPELENLTGCDVVFFATPNGIAMNFARDLLDKGIKLIDLAADFRFKDVSLWEKWYGMKHACPELLKQAVYGLPEMNRDLLKTAQLVGSAGCYTTAAQLALLPVMDEASLDFDNIIIDAKSGSSGAGRSLKVGTLFAECGENFSAYGVSGHRHLPELCHSLENHTGKTVGLTFVPHLLPMVRGILATCYLKFPKGFDLQELQAKYQSRYEQEVFVDVMNKQSLPATKTVRASNMCRMALHQQNESTLIVVSVIDNLVKGASGQAVQNMNLMMGLEESEGLLLNPVYP